MKKKVDVARVIVFGIGGMIIVLLLSAYLMGYRRTAEISMKPALDEQAIIRVDFGRLPEEEEIAVFYRPGPKREKSAKRVELRQGEWYWMKADNYGWSGEDSDHYGWVHQSAVVGTVAEIWSPSRRANLKQPAGRLWNRLILSHSPSRLRCSPDRAAVAVSYRDGRLDLELEDRTLHLSNDAWFAKWDGEYLVCRVEAGEEWFSVNELRVTKRFSNAELAKMKRDSDRKMAKEQALALAKTLTMEGAFIRTDQPELCDGRLDTFVLVYPEQRITFPKPTSGRLYIAANDSNHLSQLCSFQIRGSLHSGWNEFEVDKEVEFVFTISSGEWMTSAAPIAVAEVRQ